MLFDALRSRADLLWIPDFGAISIAIHDEHCNEADLAYATNGKHVKSCKEKLIPSWIFDKWVEAGIYDYSKTVLNLSVIAREHNRTYQCGWAGNYLSDSRGLRKRQLFVDVAQQDPYILEVVPVSSRTSPSRLNFSQQVERWRCMIDVRGSGFSARVPVLLHSGRPLLFVARPYLWTWLTDPASPAQIKPWKHYIPVLDDFSDLVNKSRWILNNPVQADTIAFRALAHAQTFLTREFAQAYLLDQVLNVVAMRNVSNSRVL
jgi:hypothetical protein